MKKYEIVEEYVINKGLGFNCNCEAYYVFSGDSLEEAKNEFAFLKGIKEIVDVDKAKNHKVYSEYSLYMNEYDEDNELVNMELLDCFMCE